MPAIGIDPTSGRRPAGFAVLDDHGRIVDLRRVPMAALLDECARWPGAPVGIDSPLSLPRGLHCFDRAHDCPDVGRGTWKQAEAEVLRLGIGLYLTTRRSIIARMILSCIELKASLEAQGHPVFEVYPYAVKVVLFGRPIPRKSGPDGLSWLRVRVAERCGPSHLIEAAGHDELDAALGAHTVWRHGRGLARELGDPDEGTILVPVQPPAPGRTNH